MDYIKEIEITLHDQYGWDGSSVDLENAGSAMILIEFYASREEPAHIAAASVARYLGLGHVA